MINLPTVSSAECQKNDEKCPKKVPTAWSVKCLLFSSTYSPKTPKMFNFKWRRTKKSSKSFEKVFFFLCLTEVLNDELIDYQNCNLLSTNLLMTHFYGLRRFAAFLFEFWTVGWTKTRSWRRHVDLWELFFFFSTNFIHFTV